MTAAELILSKSSIEAWFACHRAYLYKYVYRISDTRSLPMAIGHSVHAGAEAHWKGEDAQNAAWQALAGEVVSGAEIPAEGPSEAVADVQKMVATYVEKIAPTFTPTMVEQDFLIRVNGQLVSGRIDAADEEDVHDTKTTSTPSKVNASEHRLGMTLYAWGYQALTGRLPKRLILDVVAKNGRSKQVEVEPDWAGAAEVVAHVAAGIAAGDFEATGARSGECYRCPYARICPSANLGIASADKMQSASGVDFELETP